MSVDTQNPLIIQSDRAKDLAPLKKKLRQNGIGIE